MIKLFKTNAMKHLTKKCKSKRGATLIELIATIAILSIVASLSLEAMAIAGEEFRRVKALSECERSVSLFQENVNLYAKNATSIDLKDNSAEGFTDIYAALTKYRNDNTLQDAENDSNDKYIDIFIFRSGEMTYKIVKYDKSLPLSYPFKEIVTLDGIKEINWYCGPSASASAGSKINYILDYAVISPTDFELLYSSKPGDTFDKNEYSNKEGAYSVMTGTILNNMSSGPSTTQLRMSEDTSTFPITANNPFPYKGDTNFVVIRTVPRVAK